MPVAGFVHRSFSEGGLLVASCLEMSIQKRMRYRGSTSYAFSPILVLLLFQFTGNICLPQDTVRSFADTLSINGQVALWANFNNNPLPVHTGGRYIPSIYYGIRSPGNKLIDFEASANISGSFAFHPFDTSYSDGNLKPYRLWTRYSSDQFELPLDCRKLILARPQCCVP